MTSADKARGLAFVAGAALLLTAAYRAGGPVRATDAQLNVRGDPTPQLFEHFPALRPLYTDFEATWSVAQGLNAAKEYPWVPIGAVLGYYFGVVVLLPKVMAARKAFDLRVACAVWNWALAVFSIIGALRTVPQLVYNLTGSFEGTICDAPETSWGDLSTGLWVQLFIFSKIPELFDTIFIVLRKRKLIFLHWYHHITVLLYCWHAYATECGAGLWFVAMNYTVHAVMYTYFAFSTLRLVPAWFPTAIITSMQIAQMIVGTCICVASIYYTTVRWDTQNPCRNDTTNLVLGALMYLSYLHLFVQFACAKYLGTGVRKTD
ncbi:putative fatty acid elongation protein 3 [Diplonema papillatum]|nr:putative fatty acid elongation protein 3 [Diplonema papillatum]